MQTENTFSVGVGLVGAAAVLLGETIVEYTHKRRLWIAAKLIIVDIVIFLLLVIEIENVDLDFLISIVVPQKVGRYLFPQIWVVGFRRIEVAHEMKIVIIHSLNIIDTLY